MKSRSRVAFERFGRVILAGGIASAVLALPELFSNIPPEYSYLAVPALTALLAALDKARRCIAPDEPAA